jgi:hypothetical protein
MALLPDLDSFVQGDVRLYQDVSQDLINGKLPYRDRTLEYPPYVIPILLLPRLVDGNVMSYPMAFKFQTLLMDFLLKFLLLWIGRQQTNRLRSFLPLFCYCLVVPFLHFFFLQRYDVWPALVCMAGLCLFCSGWYALAGAFFAVGIGLKIYPAIFLPPLFMLAARQQRARRFVGGVVAGLMPMILLSFALPWWRFAEFQGHRGLQCESLFASAIWFAKRLGLAQAQWTEVKAWIEVQGTIADTLLPWARLVFAGAVIFSVSWAAWIAACCRTLSIGRSARLLLIPLLAFVAFNQVLSPQYMVWIVPMAALGLLDGAFTPMVLLMVAAMVTTIIFPSLAGDYARGLNLGETTVLFFRNLTLIAAWEWLLSESMPIIRQAKWPPFTNIRDPVLAASRNNHKTRGLGADN